MGMLSPLLTHNLLRVVERTITLPRLPVGFEGFQIAHLSDLHFYQYTDPRYYERVVETVNQLNADLIAMTGDVIHYGPRYIDFAADYLSRMTATEGKMAVIGNHDYFDEAGSERIEAMLHKAGFTVLRNAHAMLTRPGGERLWIAGVDDLKYGRPDFLRALKDVPSTKEATLLLSHNPLLLDPVAYHEETQVDLMLAGHTHGGHVYLPFLDPVYKTVFRMKYRYGLYQKKETQLYLTCGIGSAAFYCYKEKLDFALPRFRHNTIPEIALIKLTAQ